MQKKKRSIFNISILSSFFVSLDVDLEEFLPPLQELVDAPELGLLTESKSFQFLLKLIYEYFYETYKKPMNIE